MQEYARHIAGWKLSTFWGVSTRESICLYPCEIMPNEWSLEECLQEGNLVKNLEIFWMNNERIIEFGFFYDVKKYADLRGCYPPCPSALVDNILLDLHNSSHPTQSHRPSCLKGG